MADEDKDSGTPPVKYWLDTSGILKRGAESIIRKEYPDLKGINILYSWRDPAAWENEKPVNGRARKLPAKWRDLIKADFEIEVCRSIWLALSPRQRYRLLWHELKHCVVVKNESGETLYDPAGRVRIGMLPHDLVIETFEEEVKRWGVNPGDVHSVKLVAQRLRPKVAIMDRHGQTAKRS